MEKLHLDMMRAAIKLSRERMDAGFGGPFGAIVARGDTIVAEGYNMVTSALDPTAHAEVTAIRNAAKAIGNFDLAGHTLYTSCEPCPMCLSAIYWAHIPLVLYGNTRGDAAAIGFDDDFIYQQIPLAPDQRTIAMKPCLRDESLVSFKEWAAKADKVRY